MRFELVAILGLFLSQPAAAQNPGEDSVDYDDDYVDAGDPDDIEIPEDLPDSTDSYSLLFSLRTGYLNGEPRNKRRESEKSGYLVGGGPTLVYQNEKAIIDAGLGFIYGRLNGESVEFKGGAGDDRGSVVNKFAYGELGLGLRFGDRFQIGPTALMGFGDDSTFSPGASSSREPNVFVGFKFSSQLTGNPRFDHRLGMQFLTDVTIKDRQILMLGLTYGIGVPIYSKENADEESGDEAHQRQRVSVAFVRILEAHEIPFKGNTAQLTAKGRAKVKALGKALVDNLDLWERLKISGHTQDLGDPMVSRKLSSARATAVKSLLQKSGIPGDRMTTAGYGSEKPIALGDDPDILDQNQRIELNFLGEVDVETLKPRLE